MEKVNQSKILIETLNDYHGEDPAIYFWDEDESQLFCNYDLCQKLISSKVVFTIVELLDLGLGDFNYRHKKLNCIENLDLTKSIGTKYIEIAKYFPNIKELTLGRDVNVDEKKEPFYLDISPLKKLQNLEVLNLYGNNLYPYGLGSEWSNGIEDKGKGKFIINCLYEHDFQLGTVRAAELIKKQNNQYILRFDGCMINYFDEIDFNQFIDSIYPDISVTEIELCDFYPIDQIKEGKVVNLQPLEIFKDTEQFRIYNREEGDHFHMNPPMLWKKEYEENLFNFDTFPKFKKLKCLQIYDKIYEGDKIERFLKKFT